MLTYTVHIIDTVNDNLITDDRPALKDSIQFVRNGGDEKDAIPVVGSSLSFSLGDATSADGYYLPYFTSDEQRFRVELYKDDENGTPEVLVWTGFLLPDQYSEPYTKKSVFVNFMATDGLGRLKGKYLPDAYYEKEFSVIQYITACLQLTNIPLDVLFLPAIENYVEKNYNAIYVDGAKCFTDGSTRKKAYEVLETLMQDMLCVVYQAKNYWWVEGVNRRHVQSAQVFKQYTIAGSFVQEISYTKSVVEPKFTPSPTVTQVPAVGTVTITHDKTEVGFPDTITREKNDGWSVVTGVNGEIYATDWIGHNSFFVKAKFENYNNIIYSAHQQFKNETGNLYSEETGYNHPFDDSRYISLKRKIYVRKRDRISFKFNFSVEKYETSADVNITDALQYTLLQDGQVVYSNADREVEWDLEDYTGVLAFDYIPQQSGLIDIVFYQPAGKMWDNSTDPSGNNIAAISFSDFEMIVNGFEETQTVEYEIAETSIVKEHDLVIADDATGFSPAFTLAKLNEETEDYYLVKIPVLYRYYEDGLTYLIVQLDGAVLVNDSMDYVYSYAEVPGFPLPVLFELNVTEVIYNWNGGEQMVVVVSAVSEVTAETIAVKVNTINDIAGSRDTWEQWTDSVYGIETKRYAAAYAGIIERLYTQPTRKIDMEIVALVDFNDLLVFPYIENTVYAISNATSNLGNGRSSVTVYQAFYSESATGNLPPLVNAGEDIFVNSGNVSVVLNALASDPDGTIVSILWEQIGGDAVFLITNPSQLSTPVALGAGLEWEFQITVTDNNGATATDTVKIIAAQNYSLTANVQFDETTQANNKTATRVTRWVLGLNPTLPAGIVVTLEGTWLKDANWLGYADVNLTVNHKITKNGTVLLNEELTQYNEIDETGDWLLNFVNGDTIVLEVTTVVDYANPQFQQPPAYATGEFSITEYTFQQGSGQISNLPVTVVNTVLYNE